LTEVQLGARNDPELMSASGHSRRFGRRPMTSDLTPETDIVRGDRHVSKVPKAEVINW
jgi:hypothetical protein